MRKITRRSFLKALVNVLAIPAYVGSFVYLYGNKTEMHRPVVDHVKIPIDDLPDDLVGFRIVAMSDLHIDPMWEFELYERAFGMANQLNADLMVLLGDYVTNDITALYALKDQFSQLRAKHGVFACLGNHEIWTDARIAQAALESWGITVLVNNSTAIKVGDAALQLAGLEPWWSTSTNPDLDAALANAHPGAPVILMMHEPDYADITAQDGRVDLQLSGHSHGGQVLIPFIGHVYTAPYSREYPVGLYRVGDMWQYTTRGVGVSDVMPFRINCPPEVTEIELVRA